MPFPPVVEDDTKDAKDHEHTIAERQCLFCRSTFESRWVGERVCRRCKESAAWREGSSSLGS